MVLHEYTVSALGRLANHREQDLAKLPQDALANAGRLLDMHANKFEADLSLKGFGKLHLNWESDDLSCARGTFSAGDEMFSTVVVLSGLRPEADSRIQLAAHNMLSEVCAAAEESISNGLLEMDRRPAVACIRWSSGEEKGMDVVRDLELCLAAAFVKRGFVAMQAAL